MVEQNNCKNRVSLSLYTSRLSLKQEMTHYNTQCLLNKCLLFSPASRSLQYWCSVRGDPDILNHRLIKSNVSADALSSNPISHVCAIKTVVVEKEALTFLEEEKMAEIKQLKEKIQTCCKCVSI